MGINDYLGLGTVALSAVSGGMIGFYLGGTAYSPENVYLRDLNEDGKADIIVEPNVDKESSTLIFLQQENGTYKRLEIILDQKRGKNETEADNLRKKVKSNL